MQKRENNDIKNEVIIAFSSTSDSDNASATINAFWIVYDSDEAFVAVQD